MPLKTACPHCSAKLVLKHAEAPAQVKCPKCQQRFRPESSAPDAVEFRPPQRASNEAKGAAPLPVSRPESPVWQPGGSSNDLMRAVVEAFRGQIVHRRPTFAYRLSLLLTAFGLCLLLVAYAACIAGIGWGLYLYAVHLIPPSLHVRGRAALLVVLMHAAVLLAGAAILYSLIAALFSWNRSRPDGKLLDAVAYPVLHCFVRALCTLIDAPQPDEIRLDTVPNAAAARCGGFLGLVGGRLVLVIGEPLFLGLDLRALAGVIAHELGHFSQATSGLVFRFIATVSDWFAEATNRTSGVQEAISEQGEGSEGSAQIFVLVAYCVTGIGRLILLQFALFSRIVTFHLMRQMEFDADRYEAEVAGSAQFGRTFERLSELEVGFERVMRSLLYGELLTGPSTSLPSLTVEHADDLSDRDRRRVAKIMSPQRAKWFDSHPSPTERIAAVARQSRPGIFQLAGPAVCLIARPSSRSSPARDE